MSDSRSLKTIGGVIALVGIIALLVGVAMPANSTNTSETCVDDPTGFGQECVSGSVSTPNPIRGPIMGIGVFSLIGGIGIVLLGGRDGQQQNINHSSQTTANGGLAEKLRKRQNNQGSSNIQTTIEKEATPDQTQSVEHTNAGNASKRGGPATLIIPQNSLYGYGVTMLMGGIWGYIILFSLARVLGLVLSICIGMIVGFFTAYHTYNTDTS